MAPWWQLGGKWSRGYILGVSVKTPWLGFKSYQTQKFIGPLMPTVMGGLSARNGHIRRAPLVGAEAVWSIQDGSGADKTRAPARFPFQRVKC